MKRRFRLASVLRIRGIQEEKARTQIASALREQIQAQAEVERRQMQLHERTDLPDGIALAFVAAAVASRGLAADLALSRQRTRERQQATQDATDVWIEAAARKKSLETLEERFHQEQEAEFVELEQRENDDRPSSSRLTPEGELP